MTDPADPIPHYPTLADLDPEDVTTEALVERVRRHRAGEPYPTVSFRQACVTCSGFLE